MTLRRLSTLPLLAAALLAGCRSGPSERGERGGVVPLAAAPSDDHAVERWVYTLVKASREEGGLRVVDAELRSRADEPLELAFRVQWLDRAGAPAGPTDGGWSGARLEPDGAIPLVLRQPTPSAESWVLRAVARHD